MLPIKTRVHHIGHGDGTIVAYNGQPKNEYAESCLGTELAASAVQAGLGMAIVNSFYSSDRFPYEVLFDSGYKDVYNEGDFAVIKKG